MQQSVGEKIEQGIQQGLLPVERGNSATSALQNCRSQESESVTKRLDGILLEPTQVFVTNKDFFLSCATRQRSLTRMRRFAAPFRRT
jgi:hypothetical protein